jgi:hypothetical protein
MKLICFATLRASIQLLAILRDSQKPHPLFTRPVTLFSTSDHPNSVDIASIYLPVDFVASSTASR